MLASALLLVLMGCGDSPRPEGETSSPAFRFVPLTDLPASIEIGRRTQRLEAPPVPRVILLGPTHELHFSRSDFQARIPSEGTYYEPLRTTLAECTGEIRLPLSPDLERVAWGLLMSGRGQIVRDCDGRTFDELQVVDWLQPHFGDGTDLRLDSGELLMSRINGLF